MHAYSQSAQTWITQFYLQTTPRLPFLRKRSPDGATTTEAADIQLQLYYSFIDPKGMKGRVGLVLPVTGCVGSCPTASTVNTQTRTIQCHVRQSLKQSDADTQQLVEMWWASHLVFKQAETTVQRSADTTTTTSATRQTNGLEWLNISMQLHH